MSGFFDSEIVRKSLFEMDELQEKIFLGVFQIPFFNKKQKKEHLDLMKEFLEKQKLFVFRLSLSNDPEAIEMKKSVLASAEILGLKETDTLDDFFKNLEDVIKNLEESLDE